MFLSSCTIGGFSRRAQLHEEQEEEEEEERYDKVLNLRHCCGVYFIV
jgi:hypothetical protein